jgi:hypothetical protein
MVTWSSHSIFNKFGKSLSSCSFHDNYLSGNYAELTTNQGKYIFSPTIFTLHFTTLLAATDF